MAQPRLLKRLQSWQYHQGVTVSVDDVSLVDSILADVQNLLNTIQGTALIDQRLGLSDVKKLFVSHGNLAHDVIHEEIRHNIAEYEPRIKRFTLEPDDKTPVGALKWQLNGQIPVRDRVVVFSADVVLTADGQISITARA